jgi:CubicO group peptidase (beta-lactamase class C family)
VSRKKRSEIWIAAILVAAGLVPVAILGLWGYMSATARPLHPDPDQVPSVARPAPAPPWAGAVEQARRLVRAALAEQNIPGLSAAVGVRGELVWAEGFGWADLDRRVPVSPETRFRIGTASTALTSAAVGLLLEEGRLALDSEIQNYVPEFPVKPWPVTLRQAMAHVAGLRDDGGDEGPLLSMHCERPAEGLRAFAGAALLFEPGTRYRYSSYGWILVSAAIEAAADEPFFSFMRTQVFDPLGMDATQADSAFEPLPERATSYFPRFAADPRYGLHLMRPIDHSCYAGAAAFLSTPSDLVRFGMGLAGGRLLRPATVALLQTRQRLASGEDTDHGLGWDVETAVLAGERVRMAGRVGEVLGGPAAALLTFPDRGLVVSVASNISYADVAAVASGLARAFAEARDGLPLANAARGARRSGSAFPMPSSKK